MPDRDKKLIKRWCHGASAVIINPYCVEVILFGGRNKYQGSFIADPVVLRLGKFITVAGMEVIFFSGKNGCGLHITDLVVLKFYE